MNKRQGKSSITMIFLIVALLLIIAAGYPAWRNHRTASRVDIALKAADAAKVTVMEAATIHGGLNHIRASELGYNSEVSVNPYVAHIDVADGGLITITTRETGAEPNIRLLLTPGERSGNDYASISWSCNVVTGDVDEAPETCRQPSTTRTPANNASVATPSTTKGTPSATSSR